MPACLSASLVHGRLFTARWIFQAIFRFVGVCSRKMTDAIPTNEPCEDPSLPRPGLRPTIVDRLLHASPAVHIAALVAFCALLYLPGMTSLPLLDPEEARCALVADEMLRSGDYVVPHLEGQLYFDKDRKSVV